MNESQDTNYPIGKTCQLTGSTRTECRKHLKELRVLTEALPGFPPTVGPDLEGFKQHQMDSGTSLSWNLLSQPEVSCARWFNSSGTKFPLHAHTQREWVIVYSGSMLLEIAGNNEQRILPGMSVVIEPNVSHRARFVEDCWYLAITIPSSPEWPK